MERLGHVSLADYLREEDEMYRSGMSRCDRMVSSNSSGSWARHGAGLLVMDDILHGLWGLFWHGIDVR